MSSVAGGGRDPRGDALLRAFARDLAKMRRDLRNLESANQISSSSIEGGTLDVYDDDDVLRERIGRQANGSYGRLVLEGPVPPIPSEPDVQVISDGVVAITWDGRCEEKWPFVEFEAVRVHLVSDPDTEVCDRDNQVGAIRSHRGETIVAVTESDDDNPVYARLVAVSNAGHTSAPSPAVLVDELDEDDLEEEQEEIQFRQDGPWVVTAAGAQDFPLTFEPEQDSEHLYINGIEYDESDGWSRNGTTITVENGLLRVEDVVKVEYAHIDGPVGEVIIPYGSSWRYLNVADSDTTDYSGTAVDDSGWSVGAAPFGAGTAAPDAVTAWPRDTSMWFRTTFPAASAVTLRFHIEDHCEVYVNGTLVGTTPDLGNDFNIATEVVMDVPATALVAVDEVNVLAIRGNDELPAVTGNDNTYFDMQVSGVLL